jgi:hypothetical protein
MGKGAGAFVIFLGLLSLIGTIFFIGNAVYVNYLYERELGSYMETATDTITPESFKEQLLFFKEAINKSGLTEEDYGALWFEKPDNSMRFQIQHVDSIIQRADAMIQWQEASYNTTSQPIYASPEAFRDVYNEKMNNLRNYIHAEGYRSDWIAKDSWYVKYHRSLYSWIGMLIGCGLIALTIILFCVGGFIIYDN